MFNLCSKPLKENSYLFTTNHEINKSNKIFVVHAHII